MNRKGSVGGYISIPPVPRSGGSEHMDPELVAGSTGRTSVSAFLLLSPSRPISDPDTRASSKLKTGLKAIDKGSDASGSHQKGHSTIPWVALLARGALARDAGSRHG